MLSEWQIVDTLHRISDGALAFLKIGAFTEVCYAVPAGCLQEGNFGELNKSSLWLYTDGVP